MNETLNYLGHDWVLKDHQDGMRVAQVDERTHALTWRFGKIHQAKVSIAYPHSTMKKYHEEPTVGIGLPPAGSEKDAMKRCIDWLQSFKGPLSPEEDMARCFSDYPTLFQTKADVIASWWFYGGGDGYDWLDGALFYTDQEPPIHSAMEDNLEALRGIEKTIWSLLPQEAKDQHPELEPPEPEPKVRPLPDNGEPLALSLRSDARILDLPPDLRPDWKAAAIEGATLLAERALDPEMRAKGSELLQSLR